MEVIVEVGTKEQQDAIKSEISLIYSFLDKYELLINLHQVIIPIDFEKTIRYLTGDKTYTAFRGQVAFARIVDVPQGVSIVFSSFIYNEQYDYQVRFIWYLHELFHAINKKRFPSIDTDSISRKTYLSNIYILFDEYFANRKSFAIVDEFVKPKTLFLKRFINITFSSHVKSLLNDHYYFGIKDQISSFRSNGNVRQFLDQVNPFFDEASKDIVYAFSFIDQFPRLKKIEPLLNKLKMVNKRTLSLIDFFRQKYETDDPSLEDGLEIIQDYMANFGMRFKDTPEGLYCSVIDI